VNRDHEDLNERQETIAERRFVGVMEVGGGKRGVQGAVAWQIDCGDDWHAGPFRFKR
jgi:hypothetical protein